MLDKELIKTKFQKSLLTYDENAVVQKKMAKKLVSLIEKKNFKNILEIGSYSGILTKEIIKNFEFENYFAIDIADSFEYIKKLNPKIKFQCCDIEKIDLNEKFDLIISNASLQWCNDFKKVILKLKSHLNKNGILAISTFNTDNLLEIKNAFNIGLNYISKDEIKKILPDCEIFEDSEILKFQNSFEILKHLKLTGVNSISKKTLNLSEIKENLKILDEKYQNQLTYKPLYILLNQIFKE